MEITPIEFVQGNYQQRIKDGECIVWYDNTDLIQWVEKRGKDSYALCAVLPYDTDVVAYARKYQHCMTVMPLDYAAIRAECHELINRIADEDLIATLKDLRADADFRAELTSYA